MGDRTGEADRGALRRFDFDRRLLLQFRGSAITSDGGVARVSGAGCALSLRSGTPQLSGDGEIFFDAMRVDIDHVPHLIMHSKRR